MQEFSTASLVDCCAEAQAAPIDLGPRSSVSTVLPPPHVSQPMIEGAHQCAAALMPQIRRMREAGLGPTTRDLIQSGLLAAVPTVCYHHHTRFAAHDRGRPPMRRLSCPRHMREAGLGPTTRDHTIRAPRSCPHAAASSRIANPIHPPLVCCTQLVVFIVDSHSAPVQRDLDDVVLHSTPHGHTVASFMMTCDFSSVSSMGPAEQ